MVDILSGCVEKLLVDGVLLVVRGGVATGAVVVCVFEAEAVAGQQVRVMMGTRDERD